MSILFQALQRSLFRVSLKFFISIINQCLSKIINNICRPKKKKRERERERERKRAREKEREKIYIFGNY